MTETEAAATRVSSLVPPPRVSIVIPVYNRADCLGRTLESALAQTYRDFETIVVDDGSTDGTSELVARRFPGVRLIRLERNAGPSVARNRGVAAARGALIAFLDSDDLWSPEKLAIHVADLDRRPDVVLSFSDVLRGPTGLDDAYSAVSPYDPKAPFGGFLEGNPVPTASAVVVRKESFEAVGGFDGRFRTGEDRDLWLKLAARGAVGYVPLPLVRRVVRTDSLWFNRRWWLAADLRILRGFLDRPEGRPYRRQRRTLEAWWTFRMGANFWFTRAWRPGARHLLRAFQRDPLLLLRRRRGARLVLKMVGFAAIRSGKALPLGPLGRALVAWGARLRNRRVERRKAEGPVRSDHEAWPAFRPPPDARSA